MTGLPSVPRQLPRDVTHFVNRDTELTELDALLAAAGDDGDLVATIAGPPGVGKTALAVHWAHRIRDRFPDGDLYIDLGGFGRGPNLGPAEALDALLRSLRVNADNLPPEVEARAAMFRSVLAGKRVLIVIDNVAAAADARPLLPGTLGCLVLITSRHALPSLVARDGARRLTLATLSPTECLGLLGKVVGSVRIERERSAGLRIAQQCAYLPLALRIVAERIAASPRRAIAAFADELEGERTRLDQFATEDEDIDIRGVFSWSYGALSEPTAETFRLLAVHPGPDVSLPAAAALAGGEPAEVRRQLDGLVAAHLLQKDEDRYRYHDLLLDYATERVAADETFERRTAARRRVLSWYHASVEAARAVVLPAFRRVEVDEASAVAPPMRFTTVDAAWSWFEAERLNLVHAVRDADAAGELDLATRLPISMYPLFELHRYWQDWLHINEIGVAAAARAADAYGQARNFLGLGDAYWLSQDRDRALSSYRQATMLARDVRDTWTEGFGLRQTGIVLGELGRLDEARQVLTAALDVFSHAGEERGRGMTMLSLAEVRRGQRDFAAAIEAASGGLAVLQAIADRWSEAWARCAVGEALLDAGQPDAAHRYFVAASGTFRDFGDRRNEGRALLGAAVAAERSGDGTTAALVRAEVDQIIDDLDGPLAAELRGLIARLEP